MSMENGALPESRRQRGDVGGLSRTMAYALENETYRLLPAFLKTQHQLEVRKRLIRVWVNVSATQPLSYSLRSVSR